MDPFSFVPRHLDDVVLTVLMEVEEGVIIVRVRRRDALSRFGPHSAIPPVDVPIERLAGRQCEFAGLTQVAGASVAVIFRARDIGIHDRR